MSFKDELLLLITETSLETDVVYSAVRIKFPVKEDELDDIKKQIAQRIGIALLRDGLIKFTSDQNPITGEEVLTGQFEFLLPQRLTELYNKVEKLFSPLPPEAQLDKREDLPTMEDKNEN